MIIKTIRLTPFGGAAEKIYNFEPGLNVLLGPNEAGKSTLVNALFAALFVPPETKKNADDWKNFLARYLPHPGGDTARVEVEYETDGPEPGRFHYRRSWGGRKEERLLLADGHEINEPGPIRDRLRQSLRFGRGTYQGVLFARQEEMLSTLERLKADPEAPQTIAHLLRSALFEAGGVLLEELETAIEAEEEKLLQNWDLQRDEPRGGRGIGNPYKRGVGMVLAAYYQKEELRQKLKEARAAEEHEAALSGQLGSTSSKQEGLLIRLKALEEVEGDIRQRGSLQPELEAIRVREGILKKVHSEWPRTEERVKGVAKELEKAQKQLVRLELEQKETLAVLAARRERELLNRARPLQEEVAGKIGELKKIPTLERADLNFLEEKLKERTRLEAVIGAMKLRATFKTRRPLEMRIGSGLDELRPLTVRSENVFEGAGQLLLESADWSLKIQSGAGDVAALLERLKQVQESFAARMAALRLKDIGEARALLARREELKKSLENAGYQLRGLLGERTFADLEQAVAGLIPDRPVRDPEQIQNDILDANASTSVLSVEQEQQNKKLQAWANEFGNAERVLDEMVELKSQSRVIGEKLEKLAPLPPGVATAEEFFAILKETRLKREQGAGQIAALREALIAARGRLPEDSTEDLEAALAPAGEKLKRLKSQARAIRVVREEFQALKEEMDQDTLSPLIKTFVYNLSVATDNRFIAAGMQGALPAEIITAEGRALPIELLSTGTAGSVALALRLALASYLLGKESGFMVMDDPLVNLDPQRKKAAARLIKEFSRSKQMIITTCDPGTAALLGGKVISLLL